MNLTIPKIKNTTLLAIAAILVVLFFMLPSCKKDKEANRLPEVETLSATEIGPYSAKAGGNVVNDGGSSVSLRGLVWAETHNPLVDSYLGMTNEGKGAGEFETVITDVQPSTTYYFRAYATNELGTAYGEVKSFVSAEAPKPPVAAFSTDARIGFAPFMVSFVDESDFEPQNWQWDFGDGNVANVQNPIHTYEFPGRYSVKLRVANENGADSLLREAYITATGTAQPCEGIPEFTDNRDGKTYPTVQIGNQCWMGKNLDFAIEDSWCYNNNNVNCEKFGRLYFWRAAIEACPEGWRLPSDDDWRVLESFLDTQLDYDNNTWLQNNAYRGVDAGLRMKSASGWFSNGDGYDSVTNQC
jgi:PKD repeat protein